MCVYIYIYIYIHTHTHTHIYTHTVLSFQSLENQNRRDECSYSSSLTRGATLRTPAQSERRALYVLTLENFEIRRKYELLRPSLLTTRIRACNSRNQGNNFVSTA